MLKVTIAEIGKQMPSLKKKNEKLTNNDSELCCDLTNCFGDIISKSFEGMLRPATTIVLDIIFLEIETVSTRFLQQFYLNAGDTTSGFPSNHLSNNEIYCLT